MGDINPVPPVRVEASSSGEGRNARDKPSHKPVKTVVSRQDPLPPNVDLDMDVDANDVDLNKNERHKLDERA